MELNELRKIATLYPKDRVVDGETVLALITELETFRRRLDAMRRQRDGYRNQLRKTDIDRLRTQVDASILRAALVAIQELHKPIFEDGDPVGCWRCDWEMDGQFPCAIRKLADEALTDRMARTNQGENNE